MFHMMLQFKSHLDDSVTSHASITHLYKVYTWCDHFNSTKPKITSFLNYYSCVIIIVQL